MWLKLASNSLGWLPTKELVAKDGLEALISHLYFPSAGFQVCITTVWHPWQCQPFKTGKQTSEYCEMSHRGHTQSELSMRMEAFGLVLVSRAF